MDTSEVSDELTEAAVDLAGQWLRRSGRDLTRSERRAVRRLSGIVDDPEAVSFTMQFVDRVMRHRDDAAAARELRSLLREQPPPEFLSGTDRALLRTGGTMAPTIPRVVMPAARRRLRGLVGHLIVDSERMHRQLDAARAAGFEVNVNPLGETVLGEAEAERRFVSTLRLVDDPRVDYVSVKVTAIASQLDLWSFDATVARIADRLRALFERAALSRPPTFVNVDMEEYRDLELTLAAFTRVLDEPALRGIDAGIALQAYLPDTFAALQRLTAWSAARHRRSGGTVKIRLVKGANLAMEKVDAAIHGWEPAPYATKAEVDACYALCLDWALRPDYLTGVRLGVASHNLFDLAWALLLSRDRGVTGRIELEMLTGIAPAQARAVRADAGRLRLYTPVVSRRDFDVAIAYLFRRLEENTSSENFLRHLGTLDPESPEFRRQADRFRASVADRHEVGTTPRRLRPRPHPAAHDFANEPDTDPSLPSTQRWLAAVRAARPEPVRAGITTEQDRIDEILAAVRSAQPAWAARNAEGRREVLRRVADELSARRDILLCAMAHEGRKTFGEADPEVTEAIDFARWYGECALEIDRLQATQGVEFTPYGVVAVVPPWNFPVSIPAGGVLAALAAGNGVVLKPAPETPRCAEIVAEACWAGGVPRDLLQFVRTRDDEVGRHLVTSVDAVILTGAWETAMMFRSWRPDLPLVAETSGKNAMVVTEQADLDLAAADLVRSAFGNAGQKCSAASLAILVGDLADDPRFRGKVLDATRSLRPGWPPGEGVTMGPLIGPPPDKLRTALTTLDRGETWLLRPRPLDDTGQLWSPGIKAGVAPGSAFHQAECFGPVLGFMRARDLDEALELQNGVPYGLTGSIHSLDPDEVERWLSRVEVGNAYVNRHITGAVVRRQPFGGWKRSSVGSGAKAGGPDYLLQLGRWQDTGTPATGPTSDEHWWSEYYARAHDPSGLFCESNVLRYRPRQDVLVRVGADGSLADARRTLAAARTAGVTPAVSAARADVAAELGGSAEEEADLVGRLPGHRFGLLRNVGKASPELRRAATDAEVDLVDADVVTSGRLELRWYLREQSVSRTLHRLGNLLTQTRSSVDAEPWT